MERKGLPFKTTGEPFWIAGKKGSESEVFAFSPEPRPEGTYVPRKKYVYKEVGEHSRVFRKYRGRTLVETAKSMRGAYGVLQRHCGDYIVPTYFLVAENKKGDPCIMIVQERVRGERVDQLRRKGALPKDVKEQINEIYKLAGKAGEDTELAGFAKTLRPFGCSHFFTDAVYELNMIVDRLGRVRVVDW